MYQQAGIRRIRQYWRHDSKVVEQTESQRLGQPQLSVALLNDGISRKSFRQIVEAFSGRGCQTLGQRIAGWEGGVNVVIGQPYPVIWRSYGLRLTGEAVYRDVICDIGRKDIGNKSVQRLLFRVSHDSRKAKQTLFGIVGDFRSEISGKLRFEIDCGRRHL